MGRRKELIIPLKELLCYEDVIEELSANPLFADCDLSTARLRGFKKKPAYRIRNLDKVIHHLTQYIALNAKGKVDLEGYLIVERTVLSKALGVTDRTVGAWLQNKVIEKTLLKGMPLPCLELNELLKQLKRQED